MSIATISDICTDRRQGSLLLPYGLQTLPEVESARFEEHLLRCPACILEIDRVAPYLRTLHIQRMVLVQHFHSTGRSFEECVSKLLAHAHHV
jgi:hypothetical protein